MKRIICLLIVFITLFIVQIQSGYAQKGFKFEYQDGDTVLLKDHPRLFFQKGEEDAIRELAQREPLLSDLIDLLRQRADEMLALPLQEPREGMANLRQSREQINRMITLSLAYRLFNDDTYAKRVEQELLNVSSWESWNPRHFLTTAEMTTAVAIGYDWCYGFLSDETKDQVEQAIVQKAFEPAWPVYESGGETSWARRNTNWNVVTNTGLLNGALVLAEKYPEEAARIIQYTVKFTPNNISYFAPNGVYYEGPGYWNYTNSYLMLLLDNLQRNLGTDFGLSAMPGVSKTTRYYINTLSPTNRHFNFANVGYDGATLTPIYFFFSQYFNQPDVADFYRGFLRETIDNAGENGMIGFPNNPRFFFLAIPWYDNTEFTDVVETPKLQVYQGEPDIMVFNSTQYNHDDFYLIAKGGRANMAHNHLDIGSFVVENQGIRWGIDPGADTYSLPGIWEYEPDGRRWNYFRNTNLAHNTLNIDGNIAFSEGEGIITHYNDFGEKPFGIIDMGTSYTEASSVLRGFRMVSPELMLVRDEVELLDNAHTVNWRFLTEADVEIMDDYVKLTKGGKEFYLGTWVNEEVEINTFEAETNTPQERSISGVNIVEISALSGNDRSLSITVVMGNELSAVQQFTEESVRPLSKW